MTEKKSENISRRSLLNAMGKTPLALSIAPMIYFGLKNSAVGQTVSTRPHRFVHIYLRGGATAFTMSDPPVSSAKQASESFANSFKTQSSVTVSGKSNLVVGQGMSPAAEGFSKIPTAFVNGINARNVIHDVGEKYAFSGVFNMSSTRESPALAALMAVSHDKFPNHIVMGGKIPLAETYDTHPPLLAALGVSGVLTPPFTGDAGERVQTTLAAFDAIYESNLSASRSDSLKGWKDISIQLAELDKLEYSEKVKVTSELESKYGNASSLAQTFTILKSGLCPFVSIWVNGFDTHRDEGTQVNLQKSIATQLNVFIADLNATADPDDSSLTLADTTTVLINSEFGRTPAYNERSGTDHWKYTSMILMGNGIKDNVVAGATDETGSGLGWENGKIAVLSEENEIRQEHVFAGLLNSFGLTAEAAALSDKELSDVFL